MKYKNTLILFIIIVSFISQLPFGFSSQGGIVQANGVKWEGGARKKFSLTAFPESGKAVFNVETTSWKMPAVKYHLSGVDSVDFDGVILTIVGEGYALSWGRASYGSMVIRLDVGNHVLDVDFLHWGWTWTFDKMHVNIHP